MHTEIIKTSQDTLIYPIIAETVLGTIVLFSSEYEGTILHCPGNPEYVGNHDDDWVSVKDNHTWTILDEVTIKFKSYENNS